MAAENEVVGRIAVRVWPDTSEFPERLKAELEVIEGRVRAIEVDVTLGDSDLLRQTNRAVRRVQAAADEIEIRVNVDNDDSIRRAISQIDGHLERLAETEIKVAVNEDDLHAARTLMEEQLRSPKTIDIEYHNDLAGLRALERELERRLRDHNRVTLTVDTDEESLNTALNDVRRRMADAATVELRVDDRNIDSVRKAISGLDGELNKLREKEVSVKLDEDSILETQDRYRRALRSLDNEHRMRPLEFTVRRNQRDVQRALSEIERQLEEFDMEMVFRPENSREALEHVKHQLEQIKDEYDDTTVNFEPGVDGLNSRFVSARFAYLARDRWVTFRPVIDSKAFQAVATSLAALSGARLLDATWNNIWDLVKDIDKNLPIISVAVLGLQGITAWALAASSNILSLTKSIVEVLGVALALPGILGGFAMGVGAFVAVIRDLNEVLPQIKADLTDLRNEMSDRFWASAATPIRQAWETLFEPFGTGMRGTSHALAKWAGDMARAMERHLGGSMQYMFDRLVESIYLSARGADDFARSIEILGKRGAEYLPRLAGWWNDKIRTFRNWLDTANETGRLNEIIETGVENAYHLGQVLKNSYNIFMDLAVAAEKAGGTTLETLANKLERIRDVTSGDRFQNGMVRTFVAAHDAMDRISEISGPRVTRWFESLVYQFEMGLPAVGDAIGHLIGGLAEALSTTRYEQGFLDMLEGIRRGIVAFDPHWTRIGDGVGAVMSVIGTLAERFGPILAEFLGLLGDLARQIGPEVTNVISTLAGRFLWLLEVAGPPIVGLIDYVARMAEGLASVPGLVEAIVIAFTAWRVASVVGAAVTAVDGFVTGLLNGGEASKKLGTQLSSLGKFLKGPAGITALLIAAAGAIQAMSDSMLDSRLARNIEGISLGSLVDDLEGVASAGWESSGAVTELYESLRAAEAGDPFGLYSAGVVTLADVEEQMRSITAGYIDQDHALGGLVRVIEGAPKYADIFTRSVEQWDTVLAELVNGGSLDQAVVLHEALQRGLTDGGLAVSEIANLFPAYAGELRFAEDALEEVRIQQELLNGELLGLGNGARIAANDVATYEWALEQVNGITPKLIESVNEASKAFIDFNEGLDVEEWNIRAYLDGLWEQAAAMAQWGDNMALIMQNASQGVVDTLAEMGPSGARLVQDFADGIRDGKPDLLHEFEDIHASVANGLAGLEDISTERGKAAVGAFGREFAAMSKDVGSVLTAADAAVRLGLSNTELQMALGGQNWASSLISGVTMMNPELQEAARLLERALAGDKEAIRTLGTERGQAMVSALIDAVEAKEAEARNKGMAFTRSLVDGVESVDVKPYGNKVASTVFDGMASGTANSQAAGSTHVQSFAGGVDSRRVIVKTASDNIVSRMLDGLRSSGDQSQGAAVMHLTGFTNALDAGKTKANLSGKGLSSQVSAGLSALAGDAATKGREGSKGLASGLDANRAAVAASAKELMARMSSAWTNIGRQGTAAGSGVGNAFANALRDRATAAYNAAASAGRNAVSGAKAGSSAMYTTGVNAGQGFVNGVNARRTAAYNAGWNVGAAANAGARAALQVKSPSRLMMETGRFTAEGLIAGLDDMSGAVEDAGARVAEAAARGMGGGRSLSVQAQLAVDSARGEPGEYHGATVHQTIYNPVTRSTDQELNDGLQRSTLI